MPRGFLARLMLAHTVTVEPYLGTAGKGATVYGPPVVVACFYDAGTRMVRDSAGEEVRSSATVYTPLEHADLFPLESRVTASDGTKASVLRVNAHDTGGLLPNVEHLELNLT